MVTETIDPITATRPQIHIQGVTKSFSGRTVVDIDDMVLGDQAIEGLIGPNGAGKTTLMRMIMHSIDLDGGLITMKVPGSAPDREIRLSELPTHRMAGLGVVKSNQVIMDFDKLTIWDSLLLAVAESKFERPQRIFSEAALFEQHAAEAKELLEYFSLDDPAGFAQSAGEKKLLDIIRCLLLKPRFLLLDEPTAGLPDELTERVVEVIRRLAADGVAVVIVEHDLNVIWDLCEQVHFMAEGEVLLRGDPTTIREHKTVVEKYLGEGHV